MFINNLSWYWVNINYITIPFDKKYHEFSSNLQMWLILNFYRICEFWPVIQIESSLNATKWFSLGPIRVKIQSKQSSFHKIVIYSIYI